MNNKYEPIEDYGIIGNLQTVALVSMKGSIDFMCFPRFDSPSIFAALQDAQKGGSFGIIPQMSHTVHRQLYLPDTAIIITRFFSEEGIAEVTDFMPVNESGDQCAIFRRITSVRGKLRFKMTCAPRFDYARTVPQMEREDNTTVVFTGSDQFDGLRLTATVPLQLADNAATADFNLEESESAWLLLASCNEERIPPASLQRYAKAAYQRTINFWQDWIEQSHYQGRWRELVLRSAITLKLLTSHKFGSVVAAPTFSLPETIGGTRNWDYRYTWIRDGAFTMYAFLKLGFREEAAAFLEWIRTQCVHKPLQLMYTIDGGSQLPEETLEHLEGYMGSAPVRIGNGAHGQFQLDIYGELIDTIYLYNKAGGAVTFEFWQQIVKQVEFVVAHWQEPDHGIWEIRSEQREFLHSRLMCWVAMDRAIKIARTRSFPYPEREWKHTRDAIFRDIYDNFWSEEVGAFVQYKGSKAVDASALLMPLMRFFTSAEPRWQQTLETIDKMLRLDVLIYRYNNELAQVDGLDGEEGTFTMCSFWYIECLAKSGQVERARENFEKMIGYANHLGLFSEEIGRKGEHLGNFPQAFTHLALISAALALNRSLKPV